MRVGLATLLAQVQLAQAATVLPAWRDRAAHEGRGYADLLQGPDDEALAARTAAATGRRLRAAACAPPPALLRRPAHRSTAASAPTASARSCCALSTRPSSRRSARRPSAARPAAARRCWLIGVATKPVQRGHTARFVTAQARAAQHGRTGTVVGPPCLLTSLLTCDVLVRDERGPLPTAPAFGSASYGVIAGRYERRPTLRTANKGVTAWARIVQDVALAAGLVDRLMHHEQVCSSPSTTRAP